MASLPTATGHRPTGPILGRFAGLGIVGLLGAASAGAETVTHLATLPDVPSLPGLGVSVVRLLGALALVLALFLGGVWLARNWQRLSSRGGVRSPDLKVLEMKSLGSRQSLWVVGYRRQRLLVASAPSGVTLLTHLPEAEVGDAEPVPALDFPEAFRQVLTRRA